MIRDWWRRFLAGWARAERELDDACVRELRSWWQ